MKRFGFVAALAATPFVVACGNQGIPSGQNYATVFGRVFDVATNAPLAGVVVSVDSANNVTSGADGTYTATNVPLGQTDVAAIPPPGYTAAQLPPFSVSAGEHYRLDIPLTAGR